MAKVPVRKHLPVKHNTESGRIITRWSYLEWQLRQLAYVLLGVNPKEGRLAVREPRVTDYLTMIQDLAELKRLQLRVDWKQLRRHLEELTNHRDRVAHGIWLKQPGFRVPCLQLTKGKWQPEPGKPAIRAKVNPVSVPITVGDLCSIVKSIDSVIQYIDQVTIAIRTLLEPSSQK